jgi:hypothetical protein
MFKSKKPRQFNLKTRYWNPEEEERKRRNERLNRQKEDYNFDADEFRKELSFRWGLNRESNSDFNKKNTSLNRMLILSLIAGVIIAIFAYMTYY